MRIAHAAHVGHHGIQQIVTPGDGQRQRLDESALRRQRQGLLHFRHIGECACHRQRRIFDPSRVVSLICINHSA
jgi:hypothetical protein